MSKHLRSNRRNWGDKNFGHFRRRVANLEARADEAGRELGRHVDRRPKAAPETSEPNDRPRDLRTPEARSR